MSMTPREIVEELDKHIIGQHDAKRAVAIALRNRWRRAQIKEPLRSEITPKNILMIGPTGVGKTEIARRLAKLAHAPFIKVEATKFTEVGYVGRDVDSIVRDLGRHGRQAGARGSRHARRRPREGRGRGPAARCAAAGLARATTAATRASGFARCCAKASSTSARSSSTWRRRWSASRSWRRPAWRR